MEEDTYQPNEMNSQMRVMKTYLKARYRLWDLLRARRNDRMTSNLKSWIENDAPDKGDPEEDSYRILKTVLTAEGVEVIFEQGRDCGLQEKRRRQSPIQV